MNKLQQWGVLSPDLHFVSLVKGVVGGSLSIFVLCVMGQLSGVPWLMAPFGASCVLLFAASASPLAQPRNVVFGHLVTSLIGLVFLHAFGDSFLVMSLAVGVAIGAMQVFGIVHPPAGANPIVIMLLGQHVLGWDYLLFPVLSGAMALVAIAYSVNNIGKGSKWPVRWWL